MKKPIIAIDIDDVIAAGTDSFRQEVNKLMGTNLTPEDYQVPGDFWGYYERVWANHGIENVPRVQLDVVMITDQSHVPLLPGASFAIGELSKRFEIIIVTARDQKWEKATLIWLKSHFGDTFKSVHFAGNSDDKSAKTKGQLCVEVGAGYLIDDNPHNGMTAVDEGLKGILFGEYGWHHEAPDVLIRCRDWPAVLEYFQDAV
jgi:5'(3')-deoxyribonucleotidase